MFETYLQHGRYLKGWSPKTEVVYRRAFTSFQQSLGVSDRPINISSGLPPHQSDLLSKAQLEAWVVWMRKKPLSPACMNIYIRAINAYCSWLHSEGHPEVKIKQVPAPLKAITVFSDSDIRAIHSFRPRGRVQLRTWSMLCILLDTGLRINELITLETTKVDLDNLVLTVTGKGNKQRHVPISLEGRKILFKWNKYSGRLFFCARHDSKLMYRNVYRDILGLCRLLGITKRVHCHLTRHTFAVNYIRRGGDMYRLSRILGHTSISTTQIYLRSMGIEHIGENHSSLSPLSRG